MDPCNFSNKALSHSREVEIHIRPKLYHFGRYLVKAKLFCRKCFVPVTGLECSHGKIFIPVTEISVAKTEISVTGPARPLIWTHRYFYKEKSGEARSRKPSQPGWPGSHEEALNGVFFVFKSLLGIERQTKLLKKSFLTRKPRSHVRIFIYRTWPNTESCLYTSLFFVVKYFF